MKRSSPAPIVGSALLALSLGLFAIELAAQPGDAPRQCPRHEKLFASAPSGDTLQCPRGADSEDCPSAMHCPRHQDALPGPHCRVAFLARALELDANQLSLVGAIDSGWLLETESVRERMCAVQESLRALSSRGTGAQADAERLIDEAATLRAQIEKRRFAADMRIRAILTPAQQAKLDALPLSGPKDIGRPLCGKGGRGPHHGSTPGTGN